MRRTWILLLLAAPAVAPLEGADVIGACTAEQRQQARPLERETEIDIVDYRDNQKTPEFPNGTLRIWSRFKNTTAGKEFFPPFCFTINGRTTLDRVNRITLPIVGFSEIAAGPTDDVVLSPGEKTKDELAFVVEHKKQWFSFWVDFNAKVCNAPWKLAVNGPRIDIRFDPNGACGVSPCTKIVFIQVLRETAVKNDGSEEFTKSSTWGFPAGHDADTTGNFYRVDRLWGRSEPYYGGNGAGTGASTPGSSNGASAAATMGDAPSQSDGTFPAGYKGLRIEFETAAFCAGGDDRGRYFGRTLWKWERTKGGGSGSATAVLSDRALPTQDYVDALNLWVQNHGFALPAVP